MCRAGGHSPAPGVEHQARARHRLERCGREDRGAHDLHASTRLAARRGSHANCPRHSRSRRSRSRSRPSCRSGRRIWSPIPQGGGSRIREGVAEDRRVSIADQEMRHGRKSKSKRFNGFKRHIAADVDRGLILACAITPANRPEDEAMPSLTVDMAHQGLDVDHLLIDRGYINSTLVDEVLGQARHDRLQTVDVAQRPACFRSRPSRSTSATARSSARTDRCKASRSAPWSNSIPTSAIDVPCARNAPPPSSATGAPSPSRRTNSSSSDSASRSRRPLDARALRERTMIEHKLAHISQRQGNAARYVGVRKNTFDLRRASAIQNLETLHRVRSRVAKGCVMTSLSNRSAF